jgi:hypothetical protein
MAMAEGREPLKEQDVTALVEVGRRKHIPEPCDFARAGEYRFLYG